MKDNSNEKTGDANVNTPSRDKPKYLRITKMGEEFAERFVLLDKRYNAFLEEIEKMGTKNQKRPKIKRRRKKGN
jgi:hypothetical protein